MSALICNSTYSDHSILSPSVAYKTALLALPITLHHEDVSYGSSQWYTLSAILPNAALQADDTTSIMKGYNSSHRSIPRRRCYRCSHRGNDALQARHRSGHEGLGWAEEQGLGWAWQWPKRRKV